MSGMVLSSGGDGRLIRFIRSSGQTGPMGNDPIPTCEQARALAAAVLDGTLSGGQREALAELLHRIDMAVTLEPRAAERYPDNEECQAYYVAGCWEPVGTAYAKLVAIVRSGRGGAPRSLESPPHRGTPPRGSSTGYR